MLKILSLKRNSLIFFRKKFFLLLFLQICALYFLIQNSYLSFFQYKSWPFKDFHVENWKSSQSFILPDIDGDQYFRAIGGNKECFIEGTNWTTYTNSTCDCLPNYFGNDCGIPSSVWFGAYQTLERESKNRLIRRKKARRLIHGLPLNHEIDFLEIRMNTLKDVVDVFLLQESNYTTFGTSKSLIFLQKFKDGWLRDFQSKILYILLPFFSEKSKGSGWYADAFIRMYLSQKGISLLANPRNDDLFLLLDADELPEPSALLFLKLYDGYTEPIRLGFRWNNYGFFWVKAAESSSFFKRRTKKTRKKPKEQLLLLYAICSLGLLSQVYGNNAMLLRRNMLNHPLLKTHLSNYSRTHDVQEWNIGVIGHYAGHHCSWCYSPEGIRTKLLSAQKDDKPRWGDYPEKTNLTYIADLISNGGWFDGTFPYIRAYPNESNYAPPYVLSHWKDFERLLVKP